MNTHKPTLGWVPQTGDLLEMAPRNRWNFPAGRYRLSRSTQGRFRLAGVTTDAETTLSPAMLTAAHIGGSFRPIDGQTLDAEAQEIALRLRAPLMGNRRSSHRAQHDASALDLFRAANEPGLGL